MSATNAERVAEHIKEYGAKGIMIHTLPGTPFWLICQSNNMTGKWKITLGHPMQRRAYNIMKDITNKEHYELWNELIQLEMSKRIKTALKTIRKQMENYLRNRVSKPIVVNELHSSELRKDKTLRVAIRITKASLKEIKNKHEQKTKKTRTKV